MGLLYRAGPAALRRIRKTGGLVPDVIRAIVGPATGPRWLSFAALDDALHASGLLSAQFARGGTLLVGASAGAWRMAAHAASEPVPTLRRLRELYITRELPRRPSPAALSSIYRGLIEEVFPQEVARDVVGNPRLRLGVIAARLRAGWGNGSWTHRLRWGGAMANHACGGRGLARLVERTLFVTEGHEPLEVPHGSIAPLTLENLVPALLASGSVPGYLEPVAVPAAPAGEYVDGGLTDYHLAAPFGAGGITLILHHTSRLKAQWFDKHLPWRRTAPGLLENVLLICPDKGHVASLPDGKHPDRADFVRFARAPEQRFTRWREAVKRSDELAQRFLDDQEKGNVAALVRPFER